MPKSTSPDDEPRRHQAPRPLPPPYNAPRRTPQPYIPPRPAQPPRSTTSPRAYQSAAEPGTGTNPEPPRQRPSDRRQQVVFALIGVAIAVIAVSFVIYNAGRAERDDDGNIAEAGTVYTDELEVGDCLDRFDATTAIADVPAVPCSQPHDGEIVGTFELPDGPYPEEQEIFRIADARCTEVLHAYAPKAYADPLVGVTYLYPTRFAWDEHSDREVTCIGASVTGPATGRLTDR